MKEISYQPGKATGMSQERHRKNLLHAFRVTVLDIISGVSMEIRVMKSRMTINSYSCVLFVVVVFFFKRLLFYQKS